MKKIFALLMVLLAGGFAVAGDPIINKLTWQSSPNTFTDMGKVTVWNDTTTQIKVDDGAGDGGFTIFVRMDGPQIIGGIVVYPRHNMALLKAYYDYKFGRGKIEDDAVVWEVKDFKYVLYSDGWGYTCVNFFKVARFEGYPLWLMSARSSR